MDIEFKGHVLPNITFKSGECSNEPWDFNTIKKIDHTIKPEYFKCENEK